MTRDEVLAVLREVILETLPEVKEDDIHLDQELSDLGANSIDRSEIILETMIRLGVNVPLVEVGVIKKIDELVDFYFNKLNEQ